jgi:hypothetical protein
MGSCTDRYSGTQAVECLLDRHTEIFQRAFIMPLKAQQGLCSDGMESSVCSSGSALMVGDAEVLIALCTALPTPWMYRRYNIQTTYYQINANGSKTYITNAGYFKKKVFMPDTLFGKAITNQNVQVRGVG